MFYFRREEVSVCFATTQKVIRDLSLASHLCHQAIVAMVVRFVDGIGPLLPR